MTVPAILQVEERQKTHVLFLLDASGSMAVIRKEALGNFNEQLQQIRKASEGQDVKVSVISFNDPGQDKVACWGKDISEVKELEPADYFPTGVTALFDAVGNHVPAIRRNVDDDKGSAGILVIITDGHENSSKELKKEHVQKILGGLEKADNWTVVYMGANQDLWAASQDLGIRVASTYKYTATGAGLRGLAGRTERGWQHYFNTRSDGVKSTNFWDEEIDGNSKSS